jgi:hypothetical protein
MTAPAAKPSLSVVENKPAPPRKKTAKAKKQVEPATRPILLESEVYRREQERLLNETNGKIEVILASEQQAEADYQEAVALLTKTREAERAAQAHRKADLLRIHDGCAAALNASEAREPPPAGQVIHSSEGKAAE